ncbi:unnamed protein product [Notodromas monacha]|uniref:Diacylglycerol kinase n=1 Tax=Notodromas monacha TaxID=399045 RepID=A0A7R9GDN0_9CRUS|nr:unnamed protein product [Notodromas monacha]CAG0918863.1 unnamed protein product [Notodromas monacha]
MEEWVAGSILGHHVCSGGGRTAGIAPIMSAKRSYGPSSNQYGSHHDSYSRDWSHPISYHDHLQRDHGHHHSSHHLFDHVHYHEASAMEKACLDSLRGHHVWEAMSHARPTYCNLCREALRGVTSHGLSCEVCKLKAHKSCAAKAVKNCKWTTLASVGRDIIENEDGSLGMPHQWIEGNLPVSAKCVVCEKACGSVLRLQDWRCMWCKDCVHTACRPGAPPVCNLGPARVSLVPPTSLHSLGLTGADEPYEVIRPVGSSPLLVFVNSKSGDNHAGVKFFKRFRQLLNPAQVFDLSVSGPSTGLKLFRAFDPFRILVCGGDGSVAWVLAEIDKLAMHKQCQVGILPLGTGNDLARVLGWGSSCDDDAHLPTLLGRYEKGVPQMMDRWSIMTRESHLAQPINEVSTGMKEAVPGGNNFYLYPGAAQNSRTSSRATSPMPHPHHLAKSPLIPPGNPSCFSDISLPLTHQISSLSAFLPIAAYEDTVFAQIATLLKAQEKHVVDNAVKILKDTIKAFVMCVTNVLETHVSPPAEAEPTILDPQAQQMITKKCGILQESLDSLLRALHTKRAADTKATLYQQQHPGVCVSGASQFDIDLDVYGLEDQNACNSLGSSDRDPLTLLEQESPSDQMNDDSRSPDEQASSSDFSSSHHAQNQQSSLKEAETKVGHSSSPKRYQANSGVPRSSPTKPCSEREREESPTNSLNAAKTAKKSERDAPVSTRCTHTMEMKDNFSDDDRATDDESDNSSHAGSADGENSDDPAEQQHLDDSESNGSDREDPHVLRRLRSKRQQFKQTKTATHIDTSDEYEGNVLEMLSGRPIGDSKPKLDIPCCQAMTMSCTSATPARKHQSANVVASPAKLTKTKMEAVNRLKQEQMHVREVLIHRANTLKMIMRGIIDKVDSLLEEQVKQSAKLREAKLDKSCEPVEQETQNKETSAPLSTNLLIPEVNTRPQSAGLLEMKYAAGGLLSASEEIDCYEESKSLFGIQQQQENTKKSARLLNTPRGSMMDSFDLDPNPADIPEFPVAEEIILLDQKPQLDTLKPPDNSSYQKDNHLCPPVKTGMGSQFDSVEEEIILPAITLSMPSPDEEKKDGKEKDEASYPEETKDVLGQPQPSASLLTVPMFDAEIISNVYSSTPMSRTRQSSIASSAGHVMSAAVSPSKSSKAEAPTISSSYSPGRKSSTHLGPRWLLHPRSFSFSHAPPPSPGANAPLSGADVGSSGSSTASYLKSLTTRRISMLAMPRMRRFRSPSAAVPSMSNSSTTSTSFTVVNGKRKLPIINPLVQLPMWPNVTAHSGTGLISKVLLANADALCASALPLMGVDDFSMEGFDEKCTMNNYMGIGIDAKITLDFHIKREEHPEKCRSRTRNFMWYGMLGSKQMIQKTYKNLEQRVHLECDGQRIPLPSLQGIAILNIPSFMGGANFWGGNKSDAIFAAPSMDDKILEVVAVFGTTHMAASRILNLQRHRIAQCSSIKITIFGEGVPVEVDGEAWIQPPGIIRIVHKNRVQMLSRNRQLETTLKSWQEKLLNKPSPGNRSNIHVTPMSDEEKVVLSALLENGLSLIRTIKLSAMDGSGLILGEEILAAANFASEMMDKSFPHGNMHDGGFLRETATEMVRAIREVHEMLNVFLRDSGVHALSPVLETRLHSVCAHVDKQLRRAQEKDGFVHFAPSSEDDEQDKKRGSKGFLRGLWNTRKSMANIMNVGTRSAAQEVGAVGSLEQPSNTSGHGSGTTSSGPAQKSVKEWTLQDVCAWLETLDLGEHLETFKLHDIRGSELLQLDRRDLKELEIKKLGHVKRILQGIKDLKSSEKNSGSSKR